MAPVLAIALSLPAHAATAPEIQQALRDFDAHAVLPLPVLADSDLDHLAQGDMVKVLDHHPDGPASAIGVQVLPLDRKAVWISVEDPHFTSESSLTEALVSRSGPDKARWFGYLNLPRPFNDRDWVIDVWNAHSVAAATAGAAWEHPWRVVPDGMDTVRSMVDDGRVAELTGDDLDHAVFTPINEGAWVAISLPGGQTLLAYHVRFDVGGSIPDGLMSRYVLSSFPRIFRDIEERARTEVHGHYTTGHAPIYGGDGTALTPY